MAYLPTASPSARQAPSAMTVPELLDYLDYTRAVDGPPLFVPGHRARTLSSPTRDDSVFGHQPSRVAARRAMAPPPRPLDTSRATLHPRRPNTADSAALPDSGSPDPGCLSRWTCGRSSHSRTASNSSSSAATTTTTTAATTAADSTGTGAASMFCLPVTPAGVPPTGKMARILGLSPEQQHEATAMLVAHKKREKALQVAPEDQLPAYPCQREFLSPFKVMQDSVRKRSSSSRSLRRAQYRDFVLSTTVWPQELVLSPSVPRRGSHTAPSSMIHSFKQDEVEECERLVLTSTSYATVPDEANAEAWALKVAGIELGKPARDATAHTPTSAQLESAGKATTWVIYLRSQTERRAWQKAIQALVRELIKEEKRFRLGNSLPKDDPMPASSRRSQRRRSSETAVRSPPCFADEKVSLSTALGDADRIWKVTTQESEKLSLGQPNERQLNERRPSSRTAVTVFDLQDPLTLDAKPAVVYLHDSELYNSSVEGSVEEAQEQLRDGADEYVAPPAAALRSEFERTLGEYARSWDQWVTSRRHPYANEGARAAPPPDRRPSAATSVAVERRSSASSYVDFLDLSPPVTPGAVDEEEERLRAEIVESLTEGSPRRRRSSAVVLDSPWSASCSESSLDTQLTPVERGPLTPASSGDDFSSHFIVSPLRRAQAQAQAQQQQAASASMQKGQRERSTSSASEQVATATATAKGKFESPRRPPRPPRTPPRRPSCEAIPARTTSRVIVTAFPQPPPRPAPRSVVRPSQVDDELSPAWSRRQAHEIVKHRKAVAGDVVVGCAL